MMINNVIDSRPAECLLAAAHSVSLSYKRGINNSVNADK